MSEIHQKYVFKSNNRADKTLRGLFQRSRALNLNSVLCCAGFELNLILQTRQTCLTWSKHQYRHLKTARLPRLHSSLSEISLDSILLCDSVDLSRYHHNTQQPALLFQYLWTMLLSEGNKKNRKKHSNVFQSVTFNVLRRSSSLKQDSSPELRLHKWYKYKSNCLAWLRLSPASSNFYLHFSRQTQNFWTKKNKTPFIIEWTD